MENEYSHKFIGLPDNEEVDIPDNNPEKVPYSRNNSQDLANQLKGLFGSESQDMESLLSGLFGQLKDLGISVNVVGMNDDDKARCTLCDNARLSTLLSDDNFKSIPCMRDSHLLEDFKKKFGDKGKYTPDDFNDYKCNFTDEGVFDVFCNADSFSIVPNVGKDLYILLKDNKPAGYDEGEGSDIFAAVIKNPKGKFELVVPDFGNAVNSKEHRFFEASKDKEYFDDNGVLAGTDTANVLLIAGLSLVLCPVENPLMTAEKFGKIKNILPVEFTNDSKIGGYQLGVITSNESINAKLFKKDYDIPEKQLDFNIYIDFTSPLSGASANILINFIYNVSEDKTEFFKNAELKSLADGLHITLDTTDFCEDILQWLDEEEDLYDGDSGDEE